MLTTDLVIDEARLIHEEIIAIRRHLHANPELSFQEKETSLFIKEVLKKYGISFSEGWVDYGIVAWVEGSASGPSRAFRGDMDALPIQEMNEVPYKSKNDGVMHACGHDVHTSSLLGAAIIVQKLKSYLEGKVYFIFQPGEEKLPGGAQLMIDEGILEYIKPEFMIAQHVYPQLAVGQVGIKSGTYMASADEIYITVNGKGGHAALPHLTTDSIVAAAHLITALQTINSRNANPFTPTVLTIGKIRSEGGATNIIPDAVQMEGTLRTMDEIWRMEVHKRIKEIAEFTASTFNCKVDVEIRKGMPCVYNDERLTQSVKLAMCNYLSGNDVIDIPPRMTAEDFAFFAQKVPACFYRLGTSNASKGIISNIHTSTFDIDEDALITGSGLMAWLALVVRM